MILTYKKIKSLININSKFLMKFFRVFRNSQKPFRGTEAFLKKIF
jgi:hypothetical protein